MPDRYTVLLSLLRSKDVSEMCLAIHFKGIILLICVKIRPECASV